MSEGKSQITKVRDEKWDMTINTNEFHRIIWAYFENLYSRKLKNLDDMVNS
jgi:hypothetical protein